MDFIKALCFLVLLCVCEAKEEVIPELVFRNHFREVDQEFNRTVGILQEKGLNAILQDLPFALKREDRSLFGNGRFFLSSHIYMGRAVFEDQQSLIMMLSPKELMDSRINIDGNSIPVDYTKNLKELRDEISSYLVSSNNPRLQNDRRYREVVATSLSLYMKLFQAHFKELHRFYAR